MHLDPVAVLHGVADRFALVAGHAKCVREHVEGRVRPVAVVGRSGRGPEGRQGPRFDALLPAELLDHGRRSRRLVDDEVVVLAVDLRLRNVLALKRAVLRDREREWDLLVEGKEVVEAFAMGSANEFGVRGRELRRVGVLANARWVAGAEVRPLRRVPRPVDLGPRAAGLRTPVNNFE